MDKKLCISCIMNMVPIIIICIAALLILLHIIFNQGAKCISLLNRGRSQ